MSNYEDSVLLHPELLINSDLQLPAEGVPPSSGLQYLLMVRKEAQDCSIAVAQIPSPSGSVEFVHDARLLLQSSSFDVVPPPNSWVVRFLDQLHQLRAYIMEYRRITTRNPKSLNLPSINDNSAWKHLMTRIPCTKPPSIAVISSLSQQMTLQLIEMHADWIQNDPECLEASQWLFSLLIRLDTPLTADEIVVLRTISKACLCIRKKLGTTPDCNSNKMASIAIITTIIAHVFGQRDLQ